MIFDLHDKIYKPQTINKFKTSGFKKYLDKE